MSRERGAQPPHPATPCSHAHLCMRSHGTPARRPHSGRRQAFTINSSPKPHLGEHEAALQKASAAVDAAGRTLAILHAPGVFFEPDYELQSLRGSRP